MTYDLHNDDPLFLETLRYTTVRTGFPVRLLEKDYYGGVLLNYLAANTEGIMAFRGGTSLTKVHADFYRMSEDLDFSVSIPENVGRSSRRRLVEPIKHVVRTISTPFTLEQELTGANRSTQYVAVTSYESRDSGAREEIKIEIGLREPLLRPTVRAAARFALLSPITGNPMLEPVTVTALSRLEACAEKFRAALTRRDAAIRDFFDIDYLVERQVVDPLDRELMSLVRRKVEVANEPLRLGHLVREELYRQLEPALKPVLRTVDYRRFDLERAYGIVSTMAERIA